MYTPTQTFYQQPSYQASIRQPQTQIPQQPPINQTVSPFLKGRDGMRDSREGRSPMSRRYYMESKSTHQDKAKQLKDLENYMQELTTDVTEMIDGASPEEKQLLQKKLATLSAKIEQMK